MKIRGNLNFRSWAAQATFWVLEGHMRLVAAVSDGADADGSQHHGEVPFDSATLRKQILFDEA